MITLELHDFERQFPWKVKATLNRGGPLWLIDYKIEGTENFNWPLQTQSSRQQELWQMTCLEAFFLFDDGSYEEWNFSPSGSWNCFSFRDYRSPVPLVEKPVEAPQIKNKGHGELAVAIDASPRLYAQKVNLTVVLKTPEKLLYFAHKHPKDRPDFHHKDTFYSLDS